MRTSSPAVNGHLLPALWSLGFLLLLGLHLCSHPTANWSLMCVLYKKPLHTSFTERVLPGPSVCREQPPRDSSPCGNLPRPPTPSLCPWCVSQGCGNIQKWTEDSLSHLFDQLEGAEMLAACFLGSINRTLCCTGGASAALEAGSCCAWLLSQVGRGVEKHKTAARGTDGRAGLVGCLWKTCVPPASTSPPPHAFLFLGFQILRLWRIWLKQDAEESYCGFSGSSVLAWSRDLSASVSCCFELPRWFSGKEPACQCRRYGFSPWVRMIPWTKK